jgi:hypothetical protein
LGMGVKSGKEGDKLGMVGHLTGVTWLITRYTLRLS